MELPDGLSEEDALTALDAVAKLKNNETDHDHVGILESVRELIVGVFAVERDDPTEEELQTLIEVLEAIDPEEQRYSDEEWVEMYREEGVNFAERERAYL